MPRYIICFLVFCSIFGISAETFSCTVFSLDQNSGVFVGRNLDWYRGDGILVVNHRGVKKTAMVAKETSQQGAKWISKYGSLTFNQIAPDRPLGGMNEAGLTINGLILHGTQYPRQDSRPAIEQAQWIQYQLDTKSTVREVIESDGDIRIFDSRGLFGIHYMV
jgi:penicillin V acylase-like amidase (Ntn superfamily)